MTPITDSAGHGKSMTPDLTPLLRPRSVALIGATSEPLGLRGRTTALLGRHGFAGTIHPVSRSENEIGGRRAYRTITDVPGPVDLALVIIPAEHVPGVLEDCGRAGVRAAQIITSGFAEDGSADGVAMQQRVATIATDYGMAVCGPNSEGFVSLEAGLCATFSPVVDAAERPLLPEHCNRGRVAVIAQSGGIGFAFYDLGRPREMAFSYLVTTGNEACLSADHFIDWMLDQGDTDAFILFLEHVRDAESFTRAAARALALGKPIVVIKAGTSEAGGRAALSHTAALAGSAAGYRAAFERFGLIEAHDIEEAVDLAAAFAAWRGRATSGRRIGILTSSGGAGAWMADACHAAGLDEPELDAGTRARLDPLLPSYATSQNPVDATPQGIRKWGYGELIPLVAGSPRVDAVIAVGSARNRVLFESHRETTVAAGRQMEKPLAFWSYSQPHPVSHQVLAEAGIPVFLNVRNCARALAEWCAFQQRGAEARENTNGQSRPIAASAETTETAEQLQLVAARLFGGDRVLCEYEVAPLLAAYGVPAGPARLAASTGEAREAVREIGAPVALKLQSPRFPHKSDAGLLALNVVGEAEAAAAFDDLMQKARAAASAADIRGVLVQPMASPGVEMIVGLSRDATFGPLVVVGLGGVFTEVLDDSVSSPLPLGEPEVRAMLDRLRGAALLRGARGRPGADVGALVALVLAIARLATDHGERIESLDLNPVIVHPEGHGLSVVDALLVRA